jgi:protein-L-isoaspartate(D-aspartate) O-methyltransferase
VTIEQLAKQLEQALGDRLPPEWRETYRTVPRHLFLPDHAWRAADGDRGTTPIDRQVDPEGWLAAAYSEDIIITQRDGDGRSTSSCSMPFMVFSMLGLLDVQPGHRVLEIGTGTGWNAALLAHRLGDPSVYTIEIDPEIAAAARAGLARAGQAPTVIAADGAVGYLAGTPYDRIIATCTVHKVPYAWVEQTRPGGIIVTPLGTPLDSGAIIRLVVDDDGAASGRFQLAASFMMLRSQQFTAPDEPDDFAERADISKPVVDIAAVFDDEAALAIGHLVPECKVAYDYTDDGIIETVWLLAKDSWASVHLSTTVRQLGRRRLWDEVETAYRWWEAAGRPEFTRFGVTVTRGRQWVWLDEPDQPVPTRHGYSGQSRQD